MANISARVKNNKLVEMIDILLRNKYNCIYQPNIPDPLYDPNQFLADGVTINPAFHANQFIPNPKTPQQTLGELLEGEFNSIYISVKQQQAAADAASAVDTTPVTGA